MNVELVLKKADGRGTHPDLFIYEGIHRGPEVTLTFTVTVCKVADHQFFVRAIDFGAGMEGTTMLEALASLTGRLERAVEVMRLTDEPEQFVMVPIRGTKTTKQETQDDIVSSDD